MKNIISNKNIKNFIPLVLLLILVVLAGVILLNKNTFNPKTENLIYLSNGRLYILDNDKELGRGQIEDVVFKEDDSSVFLYKNENDLYLFNVVAKKVLENARNYIFAGDNVLVQDINNVLYLYIKDTPEKIDENIKEILNGNSKNVFYIKGNKIVKYDIKSKKSEVVTNKTLQEYNVYDDSVIYMTLDNDIEKYNFTSGKTDSIVKSGSKCYSKKGNDLYYLTSNKELFIYKDGKSKNITTDCNSVVAFDEEKNYIVYTKNDSKTYLYYDNKETLLFDQSNLFKKILIIKNIPYIQDSNGIVYEIKKENKTNIDENAYSSFLEYNNSLVYLKYNKEKDYNELYEYKNGDKKLIKEKVKGQSLFTDVDNKAMYYLDNSNNLYSYTNKEKQIDSNVYKYYTSNNKAVYYIKDYKLSKAYGDLYLYKNKSELVKNKVTAVAGLDNAIGNE